jgi:hypothetical protein
MTDEEAWEVVHSAHTGIFTTLTATGWPVSLPIWFVVMDRNVYVRTPEKAKKLTRISHDDRGCFLVESGKRWAELAAVEMPVRASVIADESVESAAAGLFDQKYRSFRTSRRQLPDATKSHYSGTRLIRLEPSGKLVTWDNSRLRLGS